MEVPKNPLSKYRFHHLFLRFRLLFFQGNCRLLFSNEAGKGKATWNIWPMKESPSLPCFFEFVVAYLSSTTLPTRLSAIKEVGARLPPDKKKEKKKGKQFNMGIAA